MTAEEFLPRAMEQPEGAHYELDDGVVVAMAPERVAHARAKLRIARNLVDAIDAMCLPCEVFGDGMAVRIDAQTIYEPDAMVRCGSPLDDDAVVVTDPLIIVEVGSPSSASRDTGSKLEAYFRLPSLRHCGPVTRRSSITAGMMWERLPPASSVTAHWSSIRPA